MIENIDKYLGQKIKSKKVRMKRCSICRESLPLTNFGKSSKNNGIYLSYCKECHCKNTAKLQQKYRERNKNREVHNHIKKFCPQCKEWKKRTKDNWRRNSSCKDGLQAYCKKCSDIHIKTSIYKISPEEYNKLIKENNKCKICGVILEEACIDHCHKKGNVRGILCHSCNTGIGYLKDNPYIMFRAIKYIRGELD